MTTQSISPLRGETIVTPELFPTIRFVNLMEQLTASANLTLSLQKRLKELEDRVDAL
jgi:hypothetical protein